MPEYLGKGCNLLASTWIIVIAAFVVTAAVSPEVVRAQETGPWATASRADSLAAEIARLHARLDSLLAVIAELRGQHDRVRPAVDSMPRSTPADTTMNSLAAIRAAAAAVLRESENPDTTDRETRPAAAGSAGRRSLRALNPEITVTGDLLALARFDEPVSGNFVAREFELALQSWLDPFTRAKLYLGRHAPGGGLPPFSGRTHAAESEGEAEHGHTARIDLEEGYVEWVSLPFGFGFTLGKFRQRFGTLNRWHAHSLPGQQLPLPYLAFLGEHGLAQTGVSVHWLAPTSVLGGTYEAWLEVTRSANDRLFAHDDGLSTLAHVNSFYALSRASYFEIGFTGLAGPGAGDSFGTRVAGVDFALSWRPPERALRREATLRGGAVYGRIGLPDGTMGEPALGAFVLGKFRLNRQWVLGARYEYTENPVRPSESSWLTAPTLTWWQSEYVRIRAEFDYLRRPFGTVKQFLIQTTIAMGPHKHATY